eukprot:CAMPEP_0184502582 /NCGR_PEP_ID=MMETSP0113_2-20130426/50760_1 /TAXON_ID=91329 /ORGANISM="Norrisiella sphaerica, Strain BC52" /LENGTH=484 /DNA_ID=CAMNT_0026891835 /DNA_START=115 /DNA_END=1569 /DNA_ORIENTATION=-
MILLASSSLSAPSRRRRLHRDEPTLQLMTHSEDSREGIIDADRIRLEPKDCFPEKKFQPPSNSEDWQGLTAEVYGVDDQRERPDGKLQGSSWESIEVCSSDGARSLMEAVRTDNFKPALEKKKARQARRETRRAAGAKISEAGTSTEELVQKVKNLHIGTDEEKRIIEDSPISSYSDEYSTAIEIQIDRNPGSLFRSMSVNWRMSEVYFRTVKAKVCDWMSQRLLANSSIYQELDPSTAAFVHRTWIDRITQILRNNSWPIPPQLSGESPGNLRQYIENLRMNSAAEGGYLEAVAAGFCFERNLLIWEGKAVEIAERRTIITCTAKRKEEFGLLRKPDGTWNPVIPQLGNFSMPGYARLRKGEDPRHTTIITEKDLESTDEFQKPDEPYVQLSESMHYPCQKCGFNISSAEQGIGQWGNYSDEVKARGFAQVRCPQCGTIHQEHLGTAVEELRRLARLTTRKQALAASRGAKNKTNCPPSSLLS